MINPLALANEGIRIMHWAKLSYWEILSVHLIS